MTSPSVANELPVSQASELLIEQVGPVITLTLNRPTRRNALSESLVAALIAAQERIREQTDCHVVILKAAGQVFCSGHDLGEMTGRKESEYAHLFEQCSRMMFGWRQLPQPVIAGVQGMATGAGCQLASACDLVIATPAAQFATPGVKLGLFCSTPMVPLVRSIPPKIAMEMLLTGVPLTADRAMQFGLVNRIVAAGELDAELTRWAETIAAASPLTLSIGKRAFYSQPMLEEQAAYQQASDTMTRNAICHDAQEGMQAFLAKRPPQWKGQ